MLRNKGGLISGNALVFILVTCLVFSLSATVSGQGQLTNGNKEKLDIVLIVDNSGSMAGNDPNDLRDKASQAAVGYLRLNADKIDSRMGVVLFTDVAEKTTGESLLSIMRDREIRDAVALNG